MRILMKIALVVVLSVFIAGCIESKKPQEIDQPVNLVKMSGQDMIQRLGTGDISGFVMWEPYPSMAITRGEGRPLLTSNNIWSGHPCCVVAYNYNWYKNTSNADEILRRMALVQLKTVEYINKAKAPNSPDHGDLIKYAMEFSNVTDENTANMSLADVEFVYANNIGGAETFINRIQSFGIFDSNKWNQSGFKNASDYANSLITNNYVEWAIANKDTNLTSLSLKEPANIRYAYLFNDLHELPFYIGWKKGWYSDAGINITLAEGTPFQNGAFEMQKGFKAGVVDIGSLGIPPVIIHRINSNDFTIDDARVGVIAGMNNEGSMIVVANNITSLKDLRGKTVGYPGPGTIQHVLFLMAAEKEGIKVTV
jgi:NitT/TauT family transport system substrate-binding protein